LTTFRRPRKSGFKRPGARVTTYRRVLVPLVDSSEPERTVAFACQLAAEHQASLTALSVIVVPMMVPINAYMVEEEAAAKQLLEKARAAAHSYDVGCSTRIVRARNAGEAIVHEATQHNTQIIILGAPRKSTSSGRTRVFGRTVQFVLTHSPCRVMVATPPLPKPRQGALSA
jgi:basic amino acid/polyamine antiporter, APA family